MVQASQILSRWKKDPPVLHDQNHGCWYLGDTSSQDIGIHGIDLVIPNISISAPGRLDINLAVNGGSLRWIYSKTLWPRFENRFFWNMSLRAMASKTNDDAWFNREREREREREIKFIGLFGDRGHRGPYSPYKPCNHNLYIGIIIFPHIDNP